MRKSVALICSIIILVLLAACDSESKSTIKNITTTRNSAVTTTDTTTSATEITTEQPTESEAKIVELAEPYTVNILRANFPIYSNHGYEFHQVDTVQSAGIYTIVAEFQHKDGTLWGRLKSGAGWVDLTLIKKEAGVTTTVTALYADESLLSGGNYHYYNAESSIYGVTVAFRTNTLLRNVSFFQFYYNFDESAYESGPELYHLDYWDSAKPFVARVGFPGSTSAWGLRFTDHNGATQTYILQDGGGLEENKNALNFYKYTKSYKTYKEYEGIDDEPPVTTPWKKAYLDYIESLGEAKSICTYRLVYVDSDDIPELFVNGSFEAFGCQICSYKDGRVVMQQLRRLGGASYIPKSGLVYNFNGNMGHYTVDIYRLDSKGFTSLFYAEQKDSYESITNEYGEEEYIVNSKFYLYNGSDKTEVSEEEFYDAQDSIFNFSKAESLYYYDNSIMYDYDEIKELVRNW